MRSKATNRATGAAHGVAMVCACLLFAGCFALPAQAQPSLQQQHANQQHLNQPHALPPVQPATFQQERLTPPVTQAHPQAGAQPHGQGGAHLSDWMAMHQNEPLAQQQRSLAKEPGFKTLSPDQQARMQQRLQQLNAMPPDKRAREIAHAEQMERLTPDQRQQVRGAMEQLGGLPPERRKAVANTFNNLRTMDPVKRQRWMNNPNFKARFSDQERGTLNNLLAVDPYLPPPTPKAAPATGPGVSSVQRPVSTHSPQVQ